MATRYGQQHKRICHSERSGLNAQVSIVSRPATKVAGYISKVPLRGLVRRMGTRNEPVRAGGLRSGVARYFSRRATLLLLLTLLFPLIAACDGGTAPRPTPNFTGTIRI